MVRLYTYKIPRGTLYSLHESTVIPVLESLSLMMGHFVSFCYLQFSFMITDKKCVVISEYDDNLGEIPEQTYAM